jgi:hypothetical protein
MEGQKFRKCKKTEFGKPERCLFGDLKMQRRSGGSAAKAAAVQKGRKDGNAESGLGAGQNKSIGIGSVEL